jgi:hypothetical protein
MYRQKTFGMPSFVPLLYWTSVFHKNWTRYFLYICTYVCTFFWYARKVWKRSLQFYATSTSKSWSSRSLQSFIKCAPRCSIHRQAAPFGKRFEHCQDLLLRSKDIFIRNGFKPYIHTYIHMYIKTISLVARGKKYGRKKLASHATFSIVLLSLWFRTIKRGTVGRSPWQRFAEVLQFPNLQCHSFSQKQVHRYQGGGV